MSEGRLRHVPIVVAVLLASHAAAQALPPGLFSGLEWRSIGPAATGGRIADIAVSRMAGTPAEFYVATTTGGIFKSSNEGVSWTPVFDHAGGTLSLGAVAVAPSNPLVVWAGTGEADNRQSSSWGDGVYKSIDGGRTWRHMGLPESRHIGRIVIHPTDPNTVYVAAVGHLWGPNPERGVYKTIDGGQTWNRVLYKDENTGATDLAIDPKDPNVVFAAMYQRQRKGWGFNGGGPGSGLYRTMDGGATWTELKNGLPRSDKGRIGLAIYPGDPRIVYAIMEADPPGVGADPAAVGGVFRSGDRGESWMHMSGLNPRPSYYSRIYVDPKTSTRVYIMGSNRGLYMSDDSGHGFRDVFSGVHGEDHALWIDPENSNRLVVGGDGGVSISYDRGQSWLFRSNLPIGQFYNISVNNQDPFLVCGGLQDNGSWCTPSASRLTIGISFKDAFNIGNGDGMHAVFEGDDHTILVSSQNGITGRLDLDTMQRQSIGPVQPLDKPRTGDSAYRWYWTTPLIVSKFNANTIYTGANVLFRSEDRGINWKPISPDLTGNLDRERLEMMGARVPPNALSRHDGQYNFCALTAIAESPLDANVVYTGTDDGMIHVTRDGGKRWTNLTPRVAGMPPMLNISSIAASRYAAGRVYLTVDGHFNDDYHPYIFVSEDFGRSWRAIADGLPQASVHRVREHPVNPDFLVAGLEAGAYASFDRGAHWIALGDLPPVPVYDLQFQERDQALVLGTHGRGIWVLDHIEPLAALSSALAGGGSHLFAAPDTREETLYAGQFWFGAGEFFAPNPPAGAVLTYYLPKAGSAVQISIADAGGKTIRTLSGSAITGLNRACWDLRLDPPLPEQGPPPIASCGGGGRAGGPRVLPGRYTVTVAVPGGEVLKTPLNVLPDPRFRISEADRSRRYTAVMSAYTLQRQLSAGRDSADLLAARTAAMRQSLLAAGEAAKPALATTEKIAAEAARIQAQLSRAMSSAASVQNAIDSYDGLPTAAQLRQLDWAWQDGVAGVAALNRLIQQDMPTLNGALGRPQQPPEVKAAPIPVRP